MNDRLDPRVRRTRAALQKALIGLMSEKDYQKISISEIADRAGLARPTFYLHYSSKDELLLGYMDSMFEDYMEQIAPFVGQADPTLLTQKLFEQVQNNAEFIHLLSKTETSFIVLERFQDYIHEVLHLFVRDNVKQAAPNLNPNVYDFAIASMAGASYAVVDQWIRKGMPYPPEIMGEVLLALTRPMLSNILVENTLANVVPEE
ncbi:MAG: TetR/AcrR family transcriptional regulator [Anaerolineales bacterium]|nr:TetR/AcrR family transcriptional regulator [Anaerolineales bacterium]